MEERLAVVQTRGGVVEALHPVSAVLVDADGRVLRRAGSPTTTTFRSAAKPFQLVSSLSCLHPDLLHGLPEHQLALGAASHSAQPEHVLAVRELLQALGGVEEDLFCGVHRPMHGPSADALLQGGLRASPIHNNCSGKHAFMAAASRNMGWPRDYRDPQHPLQQRVARELARVFGEAPAAPVVDGCGIPCWVGELQTFARGWARLAHEMGDESSVLGRVGWALQRYPWWMSGDGRIDLHVVSCATEELVCKEGAAALLCLALPRRRQSLVLKVLSGVDAARFAAVHALAERWLPGLLSDGDVDERCTVRSVAGDAVGRFEARWSVGAQV